MSDMNAMLEHFAMPPAMSLLGTLLNLFIAAVLGSILGWHYVRFGRAMTNRTAVARILPFIALTTVLVITVVQSSLALALGLVGALSIVRFRTPIKEPEELAYLFTAIALGLGLGANQQALTLAAFTVIMGFLLVSSVRFGAREPQHLYLNVELEPGAADLTIDSIQKQLSRFVSVADLRRLDAENGVLRVTYFIDAPSQELVLNAVEHLRRSLPGASLSLIDRRQTMGM